MIDPNAPAFPASIAIGQSSKFGEYTSVTAAPGLTIRAHFAAMMMQSRVTLNEDCTINKDAEVACAMADALISALNNTEQKGSNAH